MPHHLLTFQKTQPIHPAATIFSSMFLHGGLLHIGGNMLYLWIFGDNIEGRLGHLRFLVFYLFSGVAAAYANSLMSPESVIPMIGASGAVSGILGAYMLLFPHARVHTLLFFGFYWTVVRVPALIMIGLWFALQILNGMVSKGFESHGGVRGLRISGGFSSG